VDHALPIPHEPVDTWRRAALVMTAVAGAELLVLIVGGAFLVAKPFSHDTAKASIGSAVRATKHQAPPKPTILPRARTRVLVLNGNGRTGAASSAAGRLSALGYRIGGKGNAQRQDYATTVVMYRKGFTGEGRRLARDLHAPVVGPLDGLPVSALHGAQLVVVLGAR
jgi:hypothetical protein